MNTVISALVGSGATGLIGWVIMAVRNRRKEKGDRIGDLRVDVNQRLGGNREEMNRQFDEQKADSERRFAAILDEIKGVEHRLAAQFNAQGKRIDGILDVLCRHGERLARIEAKLDIDPPPRSLSSFV